MTPFLLALQFLTIIPITLKRFSDKKAAQSIIYFPLVGLLLGLSLVGVQIGLSFLRFNETSINIILVVFLIALTGGIHLDGLADTADAFLSRKNREEMLRIMRDSHIGVMGVAGIISILLLKIAFLSNMNTSLKLAALPLMCVCSRWSMVLAMASFPYARSEGKALLYIQGAASHKRVVIALLSALVFAFALWRIKGVLVFAMVTLCSALIGVGVSKKIKGITGDTIGALNEIIEVVTLLIILLIERSSLCPM